MRARDDGEPVIASAEYYSDDMPDIALSLDEIRQDIAQTQSPVVYASLDETARILTDYGAEPTQAQVAVHCLRHGSKEAAIPLREGATALLSTQTDTDGTCCVIRFATVEKSA